MARGKGWYWIASIPDPPGPPGFTKSVPSFLASPVARTRIIASLKSGNPLSRPYTAGTSMVAQSTRLRSNDSGGLRTK